MGLVTVPRTQGSGLSLAVFVARETIATCMDTLNSACQAIPEHGTVDVLVNGNPALASTLAALLREPDGGRPPCLVRVWNLPLGDKANAWNTHLHQIWGGESLAFFIDGYVRLRPDSLRKLKRALDAHPSALGGCGVPTVGRSAAGLRREMLAHGGFHGNLCCVRGHVVADLRKRNIRIPLGLYRVDSLMGAILSFGLNPRDNVWDRSRVVVDGDASWDVDSKSLWRWRDVNGKRSQIERQYRGEMENAAVKFLFTEMKLQPEQLPEDVRAVVEAWRLADHAGFQRFVRRHPLPALAFRRYLQQSFDWSMRDKSQLLVRKPVAENARG